MTKDGNRVHGPLILFQRARGGLIKLPDPYGLPDADEVSENSATPVDMREFGLVMGHSIHLAFRRLTG